MGKWLTYYRSGDWKAPMSDSNVIRFRLSETAAFFSIA
jgi:hypothetical protein